MSAQTDIVRKNHYVPQALLRRWSRDGTHVFTYRTLVSHENVDLWKRCPISGVAFQPNLYTLYSDGQERDDFERLVARDYEDPALKVIDRVVIGGEQLTESERCVLGVFVALQDLRTPLGWRTLLDLLDRTWQPTFDRMAERLIRRFEESETDYEPQDQPSGLHRSELAKCFRFRLELDTDHSGSGNLIVEFHGGRRYLLEQTLSFLRNKVDALGQLSWSVVEPSGNREWHLTDHPVIRLNYYREGAYDFNGGWGKRGSEILMPVSPRHLLYAKVGQSGGRKFQATGAQTREIQKLQLQRAGRLVFASSPTNWIEKMRPREVNPEKYLDEARAWAEWHSEQLQSEIENDARQSSWVRN